MLPEGRLSSTNITTLTIAICYPAQPRAPCFRRANSPRQTSRVGETPSANLLNLKHHAGGGRLAVGEHRRSDVIVRRNPHRGRLLAVPSGAPLENALHQLHLVRRKWFVCPAERRKPLRGDESGKFIKLLKATESGSIDRSIRVGNVIYRCRVTVGCMEHVCNTVPGISEACFGCVATHAICYLAHPRKKGGKCMLVRGTWRDKQQRL